MDARRKKLEGSSLVYKGVGDGHKEGEDWGWGLFTFPCPLPQSSTLTPNKTWPVDKRARASEC